MRTIRSRIHRRQGVILKEEKPKAFTAGLAEYSGVRKEEWSMANIRKGQVAQITEKRRTLLPWLVFCLFWLAATMLTYRWGTYYLDADMASEMVLANQLNEEGSFLSTNWFYSSEIRILGEVHVFRLLLLLFPNNWHLVRTLSQGVLLLLTGLSYVYLASSFQDARKSVWFAAILLCPFGFWYMWHAIFGGYYLVWIIAYSFCGGLIFRQAVREEHRRRRWIMIAAVSVVIGLQSIRGLLNLQLPLLLASIIVGYMNGAIRGGSAGDEKRRLTEQRFFTASLVSCVCSAAGYAVNCSILCEKYSFADQTERFWEYFSLQSLFDVIADFVVLWGWPYNFVKKMEIPLFSVNGLLSVFGILLTAMVLSALWLVWRHMRKFDVKQQITSVVCMTTVGLPLFVMAFFSGEYNGSYFLPALGFLIAGVQLAVEEFADRRGTWKRVIILALFVCVVLSSVNTWTLFLQYPPRSYRQMTGIVDCLTDEGYDQGIATIWQSNQITELSNGTVEMWTVDSWQDMTVMEWLQSKDHVNHLPTGRCALVFSKEELVHLGEDIFSYKDGEVLYADDELIAVGLENVENWREQHLENLQQASEVQQ